MPLNVQRIRWTVGDLEESATFYRMLGFVRTDESKNGPVHKFAFTAPDGRIFELVQYGDAGRPPKDLATPNIGSAYPCFIVKDLWAGYDVWRRKGIRFKTEPVAIDSSLYDGGWAVYLLNPDGGTVELFQSPRDSVAAAENPATIESVFHVGLSVRDLERSKAFYEKLGFVLESERKGYREPYFREILTYPDAVVSNAILISPDGFRLALMEYETPRGTELGLTAQDVGFLELSVQAESRSGKTVDPDGYGIEFLPVQT